MGRQKKTPVRRRRHQPSVEDVSSNNNKKNDNDNDQQEDEDDVDSRHEPRFEVLGRSATSRSVVADAAAAVADTDRPATVAAVGANGDHDDRGMEQEDDDDEYVTDSNVAVDNNNNDRNMSNHSRKLPPTLAAVERLIAQREMAEHQRRHQKQHRHSSQKKKKKNKTAATTQPPFSQRNKIQTKDDVPMDVLESGGGGTTTEEEVLLSIETVPTSLVEAVVEEKTKTILHFRHPQQQPEDVTQQPVVDNSTTTNNILLASLDLPQTDVRIENDTAANTMTTTRTTTTTTTEGDMRFRLTTPAALKSIWKHYKLLGTDEDGEEDIMVDDLILCGQHDWFQFFVVAATTEDVTLQLFLTPHALEGCRNLPMKSQRRQNNHMSNKNNHQQKYGLPNALERVLHKLFPFVSTDQDDVTTITTTTTSTTTETAASAKEISAQCVYRLVDNQQLIPYIRRNDHVDDDDDADDSVSNGDKNNKTKPFPTLHIPGLVPTLRPYQAAAVQWMLEREQQQQKQRKTEGYDQDQWKVAWWVLLTNRTAVSLMDWTLAIASPCSSSVVCLFCPFHGGIALSLDEAKAMTIGNVVLTADKEKHNDDDDDDDDDDEGGGTPNVQRHEGGCGILAESMGLGKTVEVLAAVLANPMPMLPTENDAEEEVPRPHCQRRLDFEDETKDSKVGIVDSMNDFADDESSDEEYNDNSVNDSDDDDPMMTMKTTQNAASGTFSVNNPILVTPDRQEQVAERWIDDLEVGSCICGDLIRFNRSRQEYKQKIALCKSCNEPMHVECAGLQPEDTAYLTRMNLRRTFGNETLECFLCDDCPTCLVSNNATNKIFSRATLIICPPAILDQWDREIKRHTKQQNGDPLKVHIYKSVNAIAKTKKNKAAAMKLLHPRNLADADIILMPFSALMSDLGHSDDNRYLSWRDGGDGNFLAGNLRKRKRYRIVPSPLSSIHFWRVCIDEAQRVEQETSKSAKMALKLDATHRWAVSGTPIGRGKLQDLYGLLLFLRLTPFDRKQWFTSCMSGAIPGVDGRIRGLLKDVLWRSTKALDIVREQIGIPPMKEERVVLKFSSIERHFYARQLERTLGAAGDVQEEKSGASKRRLNILAEHLHRLRAACCHPQVGSSGVSRSRGRADNGVASRVMSMEAILDRFIDDARLKCEEAQRQAIMHTNAMAALTRLQVDAKSRGVEVSQDDHVLFMKSGDLYCEALDMAKKNAVPIAATADAHFSGNSGFCSPNTVFRGGKYVLQWKIREHPKEVWARIDYHGGARRLTKVRVRPLQSVPDDVREENSTDFAWNNLITGTVTVQMSNATTGSDFVDATIVYLQTDYDGWCDIDCLHKSSKSKSWRIVASNLCSINNNNPSSTQSIGYFVGLEIELFEAQIDSDSLQLLHSMHNACLSYEGALQLPMSKSESELRKLNDRNTSDKVVSLRQEANHIEALYKLQAQKQHKTRAFKLAELSAKREEKEVQLYNATSVAKPVSQVKDCWDDGWFDDFLGICCLYGSDQQKLTILGHILEGVDGIQTAPLSIKFTEFHDLHGLKTALQLRMSKIRGDGIGEKYEARPATVADDSEFYEIRSARYKCGRGEHAECMAWIRKLSSDPDDEERHENSHCRLCKADWNQTGPVCRHCKIAEVLQDLRPDSVTMAILTAIHTAVRTPAATALLHSKEAIHVADRARYFFALLEAEEREKVGAWTMWRQHLELLNNFDELNSCKQAIRLTYDGEDLSRYTDDQLNAMVHPHGILSKYHDHAAKQGMALGDLRRSTGTMRYLMNQQNQSTENDDEQETCVVCLLPLRGECCVLKCGHRFHEKPCFEQILKRCGGTKVDCPMKCRLCTARDEVMIASNISSNDGSVVTRKIKGSYGTKVTRIISDILNMQDKGEKGVVFSQWNDMLDIIEEALWDNGIRYARPVGAKQFGDALCTFQESPDCAVLLLNTKQGAEGLTVVAATHCFMVEPLLNNALDQQAINRVHRIGQTRQAWVYRYLIQDTIEMKLNRIRERQQQQDDGDTGSAEDLVHSKKASAFQAGGIDGGFQSHQELLDVLSDET